MWGGGSGAAFGPSAGDLVFLSDARFISEPDFYTGWVYAFFLRDFVQTR